ncbi:hypothetical protein [uncultured Demequina sp.]|uniref:hypothetical protein n=1 Tax=uncultured Demequina sp. TaxID=693499 RepID=UPI0025DF12A7|nr:hypothetical protein [uncultured Demequina sp.]
MDDLSDLMRTAVRADAARTSGGDLADAMGGSVRGRVRRRRTARAAGVGSVAAVGVGAMAFGVMRLPGVVGEAAPMGSGVAPTARACEQGFAEVAAADLYGRYEPVPGVAPTVHGIDITSARSLETWVVYDDVAEQPAAEFSVMPDGTVEVIEMDGVTYAIAPNEDGRYVFEVPAGVWIDFEAGTDRAFSWSVEAPDGLSASTPPTAPGTGLLCVPEDEALPDPSVAPSASSAPSISSGAHLDPSPAPSSDADLATATTPYQCGFVFPSAADGTSEWRITGAEWLSPDEARRQLEASFGSVEAVWGEEIRQDVLRIDADGTLLTGTVPGELGTFEPGTADSQLGVSAPFESTSISVVAVQRGEVVATIDPEFPERQQGMIGDREVPGAAAHTWLFDLRDLANCPGEEADGFDLYAVSAAASLAADGTVTGPVYSWRQVPNP